MQITKSDMKTVFSKLGLEIRSTGHVYGWFVYNGKKILRVHHSHGKGEIPGKVGDKIRSQLKLNRNDFLKLIGCPLSYDDYVAILREKGIIE